MSDTKPDYIRHVRMRGQYFDHEHFEVWIGDRHIVLKGITPTEEFVGALPFCTAVIAERLTEAAEENGFVVSDIAFDVRYDFDTRGPNLKAVVKRPFQDVVIQIFCTTNAPRELFEEKVQGRLSDFCPIAQTFKSAGTRITEQWNVNYITV